MAAILRLILKLQYYLLFIYLFRALGVNIKLLSLYIVWANILATILHIQQMQTNIITDIYDLFFCSVYKLLGEVCCFLAVKDSHC